MSANLPPPTEIFRAIDAYLGRAYDSAPPAAVRTRIDQLRNAGENLYHCSAVERDCVDLPTRYSIRLGNKFYPHMKLTIDRRPDGLGYFFRADTHDRHICPSPQSKEYAMFVQLMNNNQQLSAAIESDWEAAGLETFKSYLRQDVARRQMGIAGGRP